MSTRLDLELVNRGLSSTRTRAAAAIGAGAVLVNGQVARKAGMKISATDTVKISSRGNPVDTERYVSRGAYKLLSAFEAFPTFSVQHNRVLDAGASTGGFSQVLLERGAREVVAADVGHDQLHPSLRTHPRVHNLEGLNLRYANAEDISGAVDAVVADLSFISLTLVIPALARMSVPGASVMLMVKPQFEVGKAALGHSGVVSSELQKFQSVRTVLASALENGQEFRGVSQSGLTGQDGNAEFFLFLQRGAAQKSSPRADIRHDWMEEAEQLLSDSELFRREAP